VTWERLSERLEGEIVVLEPLGPEHADALRTVAADPEIWRFMTVHGHQPEAFTGWLESRLPASVRAVWRKRVAEATRAVLDPILPHASVSPASVQHIFLRPGDIASAIEKNLIQAVLVVAPLGDSLADEVVSALWRGKSAPELIAIKDAEAIARRDPAFEKVDIPAGFFAGRTTLPKEDLTTLSVSYLVVARQSLAEAIALILADRREDGLRGVAHAPDDGGCDLDRVAALVVHLEFFAVQVARAEGDFVARPGFLRGLGGFGRHRLIER